MSLYYLILWNQVDILQKHLKKDHAHMRLWTRFYGSLISGLHDGAATLTGKQPCELMHDNHNQVK